MKVYDYQQGTPEWHEARRGIITASAMCKVMAKGEGKTRLRYMYDMIGEIISGTPVESYTNADMERGHELEPEARSLYEIQTLSTVQQTGFIRSHEDIGGVGYSPDGLIGHDGLLEIKTKKPGLMVEILDKQVIPTEHYKQIQCGLWVTGRKWLDFVAYCPGMPLFVQRMDADAKFHQTMRVAVMEFYADLRETMERIAA